MDANAKRVSIERAEPALLPILRLARALGRTNRDPELLYASFKDRFLRSAGVDRLLEISTSHPVEARTTLTLLLTRFDDPRLPQLGPPPALNPVEATALKARFEELVGRTFANAEVPALEPPRVAGLLSDTWNKGALYLEAFANLYEQMEGSIFRPEQIARMRDDAERLRQSARAQGTWEAMSERLRAEYEAVPETRGDPWWATPIVAALAHALDGVPKRWDLVASLASDFFDSKSDPEKIRKLVVAHSERRAKAANRAATKGA